MCVGVEEPLTKGVLPKTCCMRLVSLFLCVTQYSSVWVCAYGWVFVCVRCMGCVSGWEGR